MARSSQIFLDLRNKQIYLEDIELFRR